jgi:arylsulfatase A-like enzyme
MMDLLPTFAYLAGGEPPRDRIIDGHDIRPLLFEEPGAKSPYEAFYYYQIGQLQAVRSGPWKLDLPLDAKWRGLRRRGEPSDAELHHLKNDVTEQKDLAKEHPEIVARLMQLAERARRDLGDGDREGKNQRPAGRVEDPTPRLLSESEE